MEEFDYAAVALAVVAIIGLVVLPSPRRSGGRQQQSETRTRVTGKNKKAAEQAEPAEEALVQEEEGACGGNSEPLPGTAGEPPERPQAAARAEGSSKLVFVINFVLWVLLAMTFNAYSKVYLRATANPIGLVILQGAMGIAVLCSLGSLGVLELRSGAGFATLTTGNVGLAALCHAFQALFTNFSVFVGGVAVTNALKAMEPVAAAALSYFLLGKGITRARGAALLVVMAGIWLLTSESKGGGGGGGNDRILLSAAFTTAAVGTNSLRNVAVKKGNPIPPHQTLLACSAAATLVGFGLALVRFVAKGMDDVLGQGCEGSPKGGGRGGGSSSWIEVEGVTAALCYVGFQLASFNLLAFLSPVGHAVGNCCKRVLVFGSGIGLLGEVMSLRQLGGTGLALFGVLVYSVAGAK